LIAIEASAVSLMHRWVEWLRESHFLTILTYLAGLGVVVAILLDTGFSAQHLTTGEVIALIAVAIPAGFLLSFSVFTLLAYFLFIPSISKDGHLFARVHANQLIHPLTTGLLLSLLALCIFVSSLPAWIAWGAMLALYGIQTTLILLNIRRENVLEGNGFPHSSLFSIILSLFLGGEVVTVAAGAKPMLPWRLSKLPEDTWIVDVRTKPEFYWNRLQGAENFPWGSGLTEAAQRKDRERPVISICFSGHRSPAITVMLRKLGFKHVYNLTWGILYLILLERGKKREGPFALTRPHVNPNRRGEDYRSIAHGYILLALIILIGAPIENWYFQIPVPLWQSVVGIVISITGVVLMIASRIALGRNFRVYAAPRRSGTIVMSGLYTRVRHPMYTGVIMTVGGWVFMWGSLYTIPCWIGVVILYLLKISREEPILVAKFPEYKEYQERTWRLIPFVY
jgi:protein-S-isoprenylcysteine O-methyltransferase Ste14/rhodanese-related sulfurtransferase